MKLFALSFLAFCAQGHERLTAPLSHNLNAYSTAKPCPTKNPAYQGLEVEPEASVPITWTQTHGSGKFWTKIVPAEQKDNLDSLANTVQASNYKEWPATSTKTRQENVTLPKDAGDYVMQWGWEGWGTYINCVDFKVKANAPPVPETGVNCEPAKTDEGLSGQDTCVLSHGANAKCNDEKKCECKPGFEMDDNKVCTNDAAANTIPDCASFCQDAITGCTGIHYIYDSFNQCLAVCSNWDVGAPGDADYKAKKNTLSCRHYHLHIEGGTKLHCPHADKESIGHCDQGATLAGASFTVKGTQDLSADKVKQLIAAQQPGGTVESVLENNVTHQYVVIMKFSNSTSQSEFQTTKGPALLTAMKQDPAVSEISIHSAKEKPVQADEKPAQNTTTEGNSTQSTQSAGSKPVDDKETSGAGWMAPSFAVAFSSLFL